MLTLRARRTSIEERTGIEREWCDGEGGNQQGVRPCTSGKESGGFRLPMSNGEASREDDGKRMGRSTLGTEKTKLQWLMRSKRS